VDEVGFPLHTDISSFSYHEDRKGENIEMCASRSVCGVRHYRVNVALLAYVRDLKKHMVSCRSVQTRNYSADIYEIDDSYVCLPDYRRCWHWLHKWCSRGLAAVWVETRRVSVARWLVEHVQITAQSHRPTHHLRTSGHIPQHTNYTWVGFQSFLYSRHKA
jgi:hypothetical protein